MDSCIKNSCFFNNNKERQVETKHVKQTRRYKSLSHLKDVLTIIYPLLSIAPNTTLA